MLSSRLINYPDLNTCSLNSAKRRTRKVREARGELGKMEPEGREQGKEAKKEQTVRLREPGRGRHGGSQFRKEEDVARRSRLGTLAVND